jgi:hypothetical protein
LIFSQEEKLVAVARTENLAGMYFGCVREITELDQEPIWMRPLGLNREIPFHPVRLREAEPKIIEIIRSLPENFFANHGVVIHQVVRNPHTKLWARNRSEVYIFFTMCLIYGFAEVVSYKGRKRYRLIKV